MAAEIQAVVFEGKEAMRIARRPRPRCGDGEVLLEVAACGICGGDARSFFQGDRFTGRSRVPGHEAVGIAGEVGRSVKGWKKGDRIALAADVRCGRCPYCLRGLFNLCEGLKILGKHVDGGMTDCMVLTREILERGIVNPVPAGLPTLGAALSEPLSSVLASHDELGIEKGETAVVLGCGPLGILHLVLLRARGARVVPVDIVSARVEKARKDFGAELALDSSREDPGARIRDLTGGIGADVVIAAAPAPSAVVQSLGLVRKRGRIGVFGGLPAAQAEVPLDMNRVHYSELRIVGNFSYHPRYHAQALELLASGAVDCGKLITTYRLEDARQALYDIRDGKVLKAVVLPNRGELL